MPRLVGAERRTRQVGADRREVAAGAGQDLVAEVRVAVRVEERPRAAVVLRAPDVLEAGEDAAADGRIRHERQVERRGLAGERPACRR